MEKLKSVIDSYSNECVFLMAMRESSIPLPSFGTFFYQRSESYGVMGLQAAAYTMDMPTWLMIRTTKGLAIYPHAPVIMSSRFRR
jgi:hypothetical protein